MKKTGIEFISEERLRHPNVEGWTEERDLQYTDEYLASVAACYAMPEKQRDKYQSYSMELKNFFPRWWPESWAIRWWKPTPENRIKELAKAGALIAAEIDRIQNSSKSVD